MEDDLKPGSLYENVEHGGSNDGGLVMPTSLAALTEAEYSKLSKKATLKMDFVIMPILVIMYILNYLDRQNLASARLAGIEEELGISDVQYQTCVSILFVGYILLQVPSNLVLGRIKWPGVYICAGMAVWGAISAAMSTVQGFGGLLAARIFLGVVEAIFFPGALYFLSLFYNRKQYALRVAILYGGSQLGNAFGTLFAIGVLRLGGTYGLSGWRWLFLIEGVLTTGLAIGFSFILPNSNKKILGLSEIECEWVEWNMVKDQGQTNNSEEISNWQGFMLAATDLKTWLLTGTLYSIYINGAITNFFPSVVQGLGYDRNTTYGITAPPFVLAVIVMYIIGWSSDRKQERWLHIVAPLIVTAIANIISISTTNTAARYVAILLLPGSFYSSGIVTLSWVSNSLSQPAPKRAAAIALVNAICNTPNIWGSYIYIGAPRYIVAFIVNLVAVGLAIGFATATRLHLRRLNAKLDRGEDSGKHGPTAAQVANGFRYIL
ncbi:nicotinamide mononucleotide permease [Xylaria bambusicola]|uniref:nicotinamide mononucleotide permease n=1 Tax=Xylaria bambusicola TaxID=326684 RepID=UPI002007DFB6|nr:nicotinamide mononucleotide permease [Xylaria bambusicola]KAI0513269.1 nicotinamide mononucleotide permease [Xylaria bambusicola]